MTDREMLELAALAAGISIDPETWGAYQEAHAGCVVANGEHWNPRDDDGDSRRLEVKLGIMVLPYPILSHKKNSVIASCKQWATPGGDDNTYVGPEFIELYGYDPCAATRLAVLRVAAEIGRQMKEPRNG